ncbi:MAG TPA: SCP2 sterol-binding domain-containing protein [Polyangiaceae bacterium]|nr:SCP2 sterol-binding domain-containing protein [Polyangiaceae bacterium]
MSEIPRSPEQFFNEYVPAQVARLKGSLGERSGAGAVVFELTGEGAWSLALERGEVRVSAGVAADPLVRITLGAGDFVPVIVDGAEHLGSDQSVERQVVAARVISVDADRARLLREAPGSIAVKLTTAGPTHRIVITLGAATPKLDAPDCELECALEDLWAIQGGTRTAFELLMDGKLKMTGKVELAMALGAALG